MKEPKNRQGFTSAVNSDSRALNAATRVVVILVALGAAVLSFDALTALAVAAGIRAEFGWIWAITIDGFILVATFAAFSFRDRVGKAKYYAWSTLGLFVVFSILGNAWHAAIASENYVLPLEIAVLVTAVPPLALFLAIHLLVLMISPTPEQKAEHLRQKEHADRLYRLREKEVEKLEKAAIVQEIKEQATLMGINTPSTTPKTPPTPVSRPVKPSSSRSKGNTPQAVTEPSTASKDPALASTPTQPTPAASEANGGVKTEAEVIALLEERLQTGEKLPTGTQIAEWLGKSERTGQKFVKQFKENNGLA